MKLTISHVKAGYTGHPVLQDVSFEVEEGARLAILGPNGSGKTTLLRTMAGILPYEGEILLNGTQSLKEMKRREIASEIAMMMQVSQTYFAYTVWETVLLGRYVRSDNRFGRASGLDKEAAEKSLAMVGLSAYKDRSVSTLSGGELQRVFLARTLAQETPVILLDEPTNHLDLKVQAELMDHLNEWAKEPGHTLIGVYHDINLARRAADTFLVLKDGQILSYGAFSEEAIEEAYEMDVAAYMREQYMLWK